MLIVVFVAETRSAKRLVIASLGLFYFWEGTEIRETQFFFQLFRS